MGLEHIAALQPAGRQVRQWNQKSPTHLKGLGIPYTVFGNREYRASSVAARATLPTHRNCQVLNRVHESFAHSWVTILARHSNTRWVGED